MRVVVTVVVLSLIAHAAVGDFIAHQKQEPDGTNLSVEAVSKTTFTQQVNARVVASGRDERGRTASETHDLRASLGVKSVVGTNLHAHTNSTRRVVTLTQALISRALVSDDADRVELAKKVQAQAARCFKLMKAMEADPSDQEKSAACAAAHKKYKAMAQKLATLDKSAGHVMNPEAVALSALGQAKGGSLSGEVAQIATGTFVLEDKKTVKVEGQDDETKRAVYQVSAGVIDSAKVSAAQKQGVVTGVAKIEDTQSDATATQGMGASQTHLSMSRARAVMVNGQAVKNADFEKLSTEEALQQALTQAVKQSKVKSTVVDAQGDKSERLVDDPQVKGAFVAQAFRAKQVFEAAKQSDSRAPTAEAAAQKAKREAANRAKFQKMLKKALLKSVQEHLVAKGAHDDVEVADD